MRRLIPNAVRCVLCAVLGNTHNPHGTCSSLKSFFNKILLLNCLGFFVCCFFYIKNHFLYECFACISICAAHACLVPEEPLNLELQMVVGHHVDTGN